MLEFFGTEIFGSECFGTEEFRSRKSLVLSEIEGTVMYRWVENQGDRGGI
jgi:hypothetical protein